jgi:hypothetical protein
LVDGCTPVRDATDVLVAVSLARIGPHPTASATDGSDAAMPDAAAPNAATPDAPVDPRVDSVQPAIPPSRVSLPEPMVMTDHQQSVWDAVDDTPTVFETILIRTDLSIADAADACGQLVDQGVLVSGAGWWTRT